ncbi:RNA polymerase sigma factor [Peristeroidobacter soli]|jgi:RNA polymerase sigma-70 factor (ECF subfamily)|uniref:RNA polymerase sigma factor n=1 Tax=Peristeroidobacter soli TaxID=2497877 RepID=UPI0013004268|nr:sigma-70 family RNA polymerase sigma factor [Peristeroidobacter soli]
MAKDTSHRFVRQVVAEIGTDLVRYLRRRVRPGTDARDVAQEAYVRLMRLDRKDLIRDPEPYLFRLATNLIHELELKRGNDDARLMRWTREHDEPELPAEVQADAPTLRNRIDQALRQLNPTCRAVLIFHRRDGMTYDEIAARLGISSSMVKKYLATALRHCRSQLRDLI